MTPDGTGPVARTETFTRLEGLPSPSGLFAGKKKLRSLRMREVVTRSGRYGTRITPSVDGSRKSEPGGRERRMRYPLRDRGLVVSRPGK